MTNNVMDRGENIERACPRLIATFNFPCKFCSISFPPIVCYYSIKYHILTNDQ